MKRETLYSLILVVVGLVIGAAVGEGAYRFWLYNQEPGKFQVSGDGHPPVWFFSKSRWHFSEKYGFEYGPETVYGGSASDGTVRSCWSWPANARGNMGLIEGDYDSADLKVLVFGDSFTAQIDTSPDPRGVAWPDFLQRELADRLGRNVHVVNFGRDGYGILQMVDLAVDMIPQWKPDLVVFAYITDDLTRARSWRTYTTAHGSERILTTTVPEADPPLDKSSDTAIVNAKATKSWCEEAVRTQRTDDPVLAEMEASVRRAQANNEGRLSVWNMSHSFLLDRVIHSNAFHRLTTRARPSQNPRHNLAAFEADEKYARELAAIRSLEIPLVLVHLATADELALDREYVFRSEQEESLNASLQRSFGVPARETQGAAAAPEGGFAAIKRSPEDAHPSVAGMKFYADAVASAIVGSGVAN